MVQMDAHTPPRTCTTATPGASDHRHPAGRRRGGGQPLNPNSDYHAWKALLRRAAIGTVGCTMRGTRQ